MLLKRQLREGNEESSELPIKRRRLPSTKLEGLNFGRNIQESVSCLEPMIRKWVQEAVEHAIDPFLRSPHAQVECPRSRTLQLQFHNILPSTLFTGSRLVSLDRSPIKIVLYDSSAKKEVTSGPLASIKVSIVVLDGDFESADREDWTREEFDSKRVKNREGKRPLVAGELIVPLQSGVGYVGDVIFTDNSSWIRSGKFRLGAKVINSDEIRIREATSNAFKVKDHRGESYQKHYPPSLDDEVWRLEKIARDGASHKKLTEIGIYSVRDFLRCYITDDSKLRYKLNVSNKTWETIIKHATKCTLDDTMYLYRTAEGTGLLFNSIYKVVGVTFDGQTYHSLDSLNMYQKRMVEELKQHAYKNLQDWVLVCEPSTVGYANLWASQAVDTLSNSNLGLHCVDFQEQDQLGMEINTDHPTILPPYKTEEEQNNYCFKLGESSHPVQVLNPTFWNSCGMSDSSGGFYVGGHHSYAFSGNMRSQLSIDDLPIIDSFQVDPSALQGNGSFADPRNYEIGMFSSNPGKFIPRKGSSRTSWCKVLAAVKWRILFRRNVAARK